MIRVKSMTDEKYKKWDEIVNPALERTRRKQKSDPFEDEIARAIGIDSEEKEGQGDVWTDQGNEFDHEVPSNRYGTERISDGLDEKETSLMEGMESALDRWEKDPTPQKGGNDGPAHLRESALDRWSTREVPDHREREYSYAVDMTEAEREEYLEKSRKLKSIMSEFVDWKESME